MNNEARKLLEAALELPADDRVAIAAELIASVAREADAELADEQGDRLQLVCVPSLIAVLVAAEKEKGSALTEEEVLEIRDGAECIAMPESVAAEVTLRRGYSDIDPENCWVEWLQYKQR